MKSKSLLMFLLLFAVLVSAPAVYAQGGVRSGPDPSTIRDPELERDSLHNLEVARHYFKLKKAYVAAIQRCEEIIAGNPTFSKLDEVLYIAAQSSLLLAEGKGKQNPSLYVISDSGKKRSLTPDEFRQLGRVFLVRLVDEFPQTAFGKQAQQELQALPENKPKESKP